VVFKSFFEKIKDLKDVKNDPMGYDTQRQKVVL
jgi:hypothetical protein